MKIYNFLTFNSGQKILLDCLRHDFCIIRAQGENPRLSSDICCTRVRHEKICLPFEVYSKGALCACFLSAITKHVCHVKCVAHMCSEGFKHVTSRRKGNIMQPDRNLSNVSFLLRAKNAFVSIESSPQLFQGHRQHVSLQLKLARPRDRKQTKLFQSNRLLNTFCARVLIQSNQLKAGLERKFRLFELIGKAVAGFFLFFKTFVL